MLTENSQPRTTMHVDLHQVCMTATQTRIRPKIFQQVGCYLIWCLKMAWNQLRWTSPLPTSATSVHQGHNELSWGLLGKVVSSSSCSLLTNSISWNIKSNQSQFLFLISDEKRESLWETANGLKHLLSLQAGPRIYCRMPTVLLENRIIKAPGLFPGSTTPEKGIAY